MAGRYARALFELALDAKSVDAVKTDIDKFDAMVADSADLRAAGAQPGVRRRGAEPGARRGARQGRASAGLPSNFLMFVTANRRLFSVERHDPRFPQARRASGRAR